MNKQAKIKLLKNYFKKRDDVLMAFLFGSQAKKRATQRSDWDIGVYLKPRSGRLEWETEYLYPQRNKIWGDLVDILNTDNVDLLVLNSATPNIADIAIGGLPLVIKDRRLYLEFMLIITREAMDYRYLVKDYYEIFQRSKSLIEKDKILLRERIMFLENELADFAKFKKLTWQEYLKNRDVKRNLERWIENLVNCSIDITKTLLASNRKNVPGSYREILHALQILPGFSKDLSLKLASWAELRNILAHQYLDLRWKQIKSFVQQAEPYFNQFLESVKKFINQ